MSASTGTGESRWGPRSGEPGSAFNGLSSSRGGGGRGGRGRGGAPRGGARGGGSIGGRGAPPATPPTKHAALADGAKPAPSAKGSPRPSASRRQSLRAGAGATPSSPLVASASLTSGSGSGGPTAKPDNANKDVKAPVTDTPATSTTDNGASTTTATSSNKNSSRRKRSGVGKPKNNSASSSSSSTKSPLSFPSSAAGSKGSSLASLSTSLRHGPSPLSARDKDDDVPSLLKRMNMDAPPPLPSTSHRDRDNNNNNNNNRERQRRGSKAPAPVLPAINVHKVNKDLPPHLAARTAPHTAPLFPSGSSALSSSSIIAPQPMTPLRTDIDALVEHMRASAMTDSASATGLGVDGGAGGHHHIDWAGDDDDSLPDLDDWGVSREKLHLEPVEAKEGEEEVDNVEETQEDGEDQEAQDEGADDEVVAEDGTQNNDGLISPLLTMSGLRALPDLHLPTDTTAESNTVPSEPAVEAEPEEVPPTPRAGSDSISSLSTAASISASISTAPTTASSTSSADISTASASASSSTPQSQSQSWRMPLHPSLPAKPSVGPPPSAVQLPMAATPMRGKDQVHGRSDLKKAEGDTVDGKEDVVTPEKEAPVGADVVEVEHPAPATTPPMDGLPEEIKTTVSLPAPPALSLSTPALAPFLSPALSTTDSGLGTAPVVVVEHTESAVIASPSPKPTRPSGLAASIYAPKEIQDTHSAPAHISTWADAMDEQDLVMSKDSEAAPPLTGVRASMHAFTPPPTMSALSKSTSGGGRHRPPRDRSSRAGGRHNNNNNNTLQPRAEGGRWSSLSHNSSNSASGARDGGDIVGLSAGQHNTHNRTHSTPPPGASHMGGGGPRSAPSWGGPRHGHGGGGGSGGGGHGQWNSGAAYHGAYNMHDRYGKSDAGHGHVKRPVITGAAITQLARTIGKGGGGGTPTKNKTGDGE